MNPLRRTKHAALAAAAGLVIGACAGSAVPVGPIVSPTGIVYEPGIRPTETRYSQTAMLYLRRDNVQRALELAQQGVDSDPGNPIHSFLAGVAHARLGHYQEADRMLAEAQGIYPAYELEVEPEREAAWAAAFNQGLEAYAEGDTEAAIEAWTGATAIYDLRPEAHRNLASLLAQEARYDEAIDVYQRGLRGLEGRPASRVLSEQEVRELDDIRRSMEDDLAQLLVFANRFGEAEPLLRRQLERDPGSIRLRSDLAKTLSALGRSAEADVLYTALLSEASLEAAELFNLGIAFFRSGQFDEAGQAFGRLTELQPSSRDAWFNYANSLFATESWEDLATVGDRLLELDPLNENAALIVARAHLETGDEAAALQRLARIDAAPVHLEQLRMQPSSVETVVRGRIVGNGAEVGAPVELRFTFYGDDGELGTRIVRVLAPSRGEATDLEVAIGARAAAYRYQVIP